MAEASHFPVLGRSRESLLTSWPGFVWSGERGV